MKSAKKLRWVIFSKLKFMLSLLIAILLSLMINDKRIVLLRADQSYVKSQNIEIHGIFRFLNSICWIIYRYFYNVTEFLISTLFQ